MNSRLRMCLLFSLGLASWLAFAPARSEAQPGAVSRAAINQYMNGAYGGYGAYGYQPRYYGGYSNPYGYSNGYTYGSAYPSGQAWNGYRSSYPVYGYNSGYTYGGYPAYTYGGYPAYGYRTAYYGY